MYVLEFGIIFVFKEKVFLSMAMLNAIMKKTFLIYPYELFRFCSYYLLL